MPFSDTYNGVCFTTKRDGSDFLGNLKTHIKIEEFIPSDYRRAYYKDTGRPRGYKLESFLWFLLLQKIIGVFCDSTFLLIISICRELREFCGFDDVPDADKITRFRQTFANHMELMFQNMVDATEPLCRELDPKKADYLIYDTTGIEANVKENNPKFLRGKLNQAKKIAKGNPEVNPHFLAYGLMPETAEANPFVKQQYINGCFCYAHKVGILTNGLGIIRHIALFDEHFRKNHPEVVSKKTDNPELDKEIADSVSLKPVLSDFFEAHPHFSFKTFLGDSAFDSYDTYKMLRHDFNFDRFAIPINPRNSDSAHTHFDENGTPVCPIDKTPFIFNSICRGENRSERFKFVCHKSVPVTKEKSCTCDTPCTDSNYGRCVYTYPDKDLRLYPGIPRGSQHWDNLYKHRVLVERTIYILKYPLGVDMRKSFSVRTAKADIFIAGMAQLIGVMLASAVNNTKFFKSIRKLIAT